MLVENEYLAELIKRDNEISFLKSKAEKNQKKAEENQKKAEENQKKAEEKEKILKEKEKMILELAKTLKDNNISIEIIIEKTKLSKKEIEKL